MAFLGLRSADHPEHPHRKPVIRLGQAAKSPESQSDKAQPEAPEKQSTNRKKMALPRP